MLIGFGVVFAKENASLKSNKVTPTSSIFSSITIEGIGGYSSLGNISSEGLKTKNKVIGGVGLSYSINFLPYVASGVQLNYVSFANNITLLKDDSKKRTTIKNLGALNVSIYNEISLYKNSKFNIFGVVGVGLAFNFLNISQNIPKVGSKLTQVDKALQDVLNNFKDNPEESSSPDFSNGAQVGGVVTLLNGSRNTLSYNNWLIGLNKIFNNKNENSLQANWLTAQYNISQRVFDEYQSYNTQEPDNAFVNSFTYDIAGGSSSPISGVYAKNENDNFICSTALSNSLGSPGVSIFFGVNDLTTDYKDDSEFLFYPLPLISNTLQVYIVNPIYGVKQYYNKQESTLNCGYYFVSAILSKDMVPTLNKIQNPANPDDPEDLIDGDGIDNSVLKEYLLSIQDKTLPFDVYIPETYYENITSTEVVTNFLYTAGFGVSYSFNKNWSFVVKALYNGSINNTFNSIYIKNININPNYFSISSGIRFSF